MVVDWMVKTGGEEGKRGERHAERENEERLAH